MTDPTPRSDSAPRVRAARSADLGALTRIHWSVRQEIGSQPTAGYITDTVDERVLVAEIDDRVAGFVAVFEPESFVHHLYVDREHRGRGVGAALLSAATAHLSGRPWLKVDASNTAGRAFYRRQGWEEDEAVRGVVVVRGPRALPPDASA